MTAVALREAGPECGGKAYALGVLIRAGLPVPDGFVVTGAADLPKVADRLRGFAGVPVAVRSSGRSEDSASASFAGQHDTVLGLTTAEEVVAAVARCAASARTPRAHAYRQRLGAGADGGSDESDIPVIVQVLVEADRAGVLFTRDPRDGGDAIVVNAAWGLGESVVSGAVVPDEFVVAPTGAVRVAVGGKQTRLDLGAHGLTRVTVADADRTRACLTRPDLAALVRLGHRCEELFGRPQDVEWAATRDGRIWIVQSRPITALITAPLTGVATGAGRVTGPVRVVRTVDDFTRVRRGDVLVCRTTDPAWTPLFGLVAAVVTETGGVLCHAAIVAREYGIPAIVGAAGATARLRDDDLITVDGGLGTVTPAGAA